MELNFERRAPTASNALGCQQSNCDIRAGRARIQEGEAVIFLGGIKHSKVGGLTGELCVV